MYVFYVLMIYLVECIIYFLIRVGLSYLVVLFINEKKIEEIFIVL